MEQEDLPSIPEPPSLELGDRFEPLHLAGRGGSAAVWRGIDLRTGDPVAIKIFAPSYDLERFAREIELLQKADEDAVVGLLGHGVESDIPWLAMPWCEGDPFPTSRTPWSELAQPTRDLLQTLQRLHDRGLLHRDLKPTNVLIVEGRPMLLDLGIAIDQAADTLTQQGVVAGSPPWMPPERLRGERATRSGDLYAVGVMLAEALTGRSPWARATHPAPRTEPTVGPGHDAPRWVIRAIERMMHPDPGRRFQSAAAALDALAIDPEDATRLQRVQLGAGRVWRRHRVRAGLIAAVAGVAVVGAASGAWVVSIYSGETTSIHGGVGLRHGVPWPIGDRTEAGGDHVIATWMGQRLISLERRNHAGGPAPWVPDEEGNLYWAVPRPHRIEFRYTDDGELYELAYLNPFDRTIWRTARSVDVEGQVHLVHTDTWGNLILSADHRVFREVHSLDNRGRTTQVRWSGELSGRPMRARDGSAAHRYLWDEQGRVLQQDRLDEDGRLIQGLDGAASVTFTYGDERHPTRWTTRSTLDKHGEPVLASEGCSRVVQTFDSLGRRTSQQCFQQDREGTFTDLGCHALLRTWCPGDTPEACTADAGPYYRERCLDASNQPALDRLGRHEHTIWLAEDGDGRAYQALGLDGQPTNDTRGISYMEYEHQRSKWVAAGPWLDADGQPTWSVYRGIRRQLGPDGRIESQVFLLDDGTRDAFVDERVYDDHSNPLTSTWTRRGEPAEGPIGYHRVVFEHDVYGNMTGEAYFGLDGDRVQRADGVHKIVWAFTRRGEESRRSYLGTALQPVAVEGVLSIEHDWDPATGGLLERRTTLADGRTHSVRHQLDALGRPGSTAWWTDEGSGPQPSRGPSGAHRIEHERDARGQPIEERREPVDGERLSCPHVRWERDARGGLLSGRCTSGAFDPGMTEADRGVGASAFVVSTDPHSKTDWSNLDEEGRPSTNAHGVARYVFERDARGHIARETRWGLEDQPVAGSDGWHEVERRFDAEGRTTAERFLDPSGAPAARPDGVVAWRSTHSPRGDVVQVEWDTPTSSYRLEVTRDPDTRRILAERFVDADGGVPGPDGWSRRTRTYGPTRAISRYAIYDADDELMGQWSPPEPAPSWASSTGALAMEPWLQ